MRAAELGGRLPVIEVLTYAEKALDVLAATHAAGMIHRDLKPENLFIVRGGDLKVLDFGIARLRSGETDGHKRTRTGMVMGTPAFMAPEQARALWSEVDARTDLWAIGAIMHSLITGKDVHEGKTANELIVRAATTPIPSLARFAQVPIDVVRLVDRAAAFDKAERFPDATVMRAAVTAALAQLKPQAARARINEEREALDIDVYDPAFATDTDLVALSEIFTLLDRALHASSQYGRGHPEAEKKLAAVIDRCMAALGQTDGAIAWNLTPYGFVVRDKPLWEPRPPNDRIPYQLFADGVRTMTLLPGLEAAELRTLVDIIIMDRATQMAPEDDFVTLLWDAGFEHVTYQAIDSFAEGDQGQRVRFEEQARDVVALAHFDTSVQLEDCWQESHGQGQGVDRAAAILAALRGDRVDLEARVKAEAMLAVREATMAETSAVLQVQPDVLTTLAARLALDTADLGPRFARAVAMAWLEAQHDGTTNALAAPMRAAIDGLAVSAPKVVIALVTSVCRAGLDPAGRATLVRALLVPKTLQRILETSAGDASSALDLVELLSLVDDTHMPTVLDTFGTLQDGMVKEAALDFLVRVGKGHEQRLAGAFAEATVDHALAIIRVLTRISTPEAKSAIMRASSSPHAIVRIEALGHIEGVTSERLRLELKALLEDSELGVRTAAMRSVQRNRVRVAGPGLVLRIKSSAFDALSVDERKLALETLEALAPTRAEDVCLELLAGGRVITSDAHEETRALAAEVLGRVSSSDETVRALETAAGARWRNSERVRESAGRARDFAVIRLSQAPGPPSKAPPSKKGPS